MIEEKEIERLLSDALTQLHRVVSGADTLRSAVAALDTIGTIAVAGRDLAKRFPVLAPAIVEALSEAASPLSDAASAFVSIDQVYFGLGATSGLFHHDEDEYHRERLLHLGLLKIALTQSVLRDELNRSGNLLMHRVEQRQAEAAQHFSLSLH